MKFISGAIIASVALWTASSAHAKDVRAICIAVGKMGQNSVSAAADQAQQVSSLKANIAQWDDIPEARRAAISLILELLFVQQEAQIKLTIDEMKELLSMCQS